MAAIMVATSTTVDLSQLPAPIIVEHKSFDVILTDMVATMRTLLPQFDASIDSDPAIKVLQIAAYREQLLRQAFQDAAQQLLVAYAREANLDHLGALVGVVRLVIVAADPVTGADAVMETDDSLRQRIVLAPEAFSVAGPELAYVAHAKAASGDVLDASATSPAPGEVLVSVLSVVGDGTASRALLDTVQAVVADNAIRPLGDHVTTASAEIIPFAIDAALTTFSGPDVGIVLAAARAGAAAYVADCHKLGRNVRRAGLDAAMKVAGVENVVITAPAGDVLCDATQAPHCTGILITHAGDAA